MNTKILSTAALAAFAATSAFAETYEITQWGETIAPDSEITNPFYGTDLNAAHNLGGNTYVIKIDGTTAENPFELKNADGTLSGTRFNNGSIVIDGHYIGSRIGDGGNPGLVIRDNSSFTITGTNGNNMANFWAGFITVGQSSKLATRMNMLLKCDNTVNGALVVTSTALGVNTFAFSVKNAVFNAGATLSSQSGAGFSTYGLDEAKEGCTITVNSGVAKGALAVAGLVNFAGKTTVNFNASDAFSTDSNTQAKSTFSLISYVFSNGTIKANTQSAANVVFNSTANNSFGQVQFWTDSTLTLNLDTKSFMAFGEFTMHSDASGVCTVIVNNLSEDSKTFFISDKIYDAIAANEVVLKDSSGNTLTYTATKASDADFASTGLDDDLFTGGYWLATNTVVPEPATYAILFGLFALGFIAYRKRR